MMVLQLPVRLSAFILTRKAARTYGTRTGGIAGAKKAFRHEAIEQWPEHWSADSHYGNTGFCKGPIRSRGARVRKVIVIDLVDSRNAYDSDSDDPGRLLVSKCLILEYDLMTTAYTRPRANTRLNAILFATGRCKCQTVGTGSAQVTRSHTIPQATMLTKTPVSLRHFPGTPASNVACTGVQRKVETRMVYSPQAMLKARLPNA